MFRLSDLSNGFPDNATEKAGEMEQQTARDLSGDIGNLLLAYLTKVVPVLTKIGNLTTLLGSLANLKVVLTNSLTWNPATD